jgi:EAL domain-containing protein (putative c-di-GMP-specific phosphodiesterase class I)
VAVNVSARQLSTPGFVGVVEEALQDCGLDGQLLTLEITESTLMDDVETTASTTEALRALGVRLSVDDFGTGYSSLLSLRRLPVTALKIDRSFVAGLGVEPDDTAIVTGVVELAAGLGLSAVAEGVETPQQLELLRVLGCPFAQGWLWSPALSATGLVAWLEQRQGMTSATAALSGPCVPAPRVARASASR